MQITNDGELSVAQPGDPCGVASGLRTAVRVMTMPPVLLMQALHDESLSMRNGSAS